MDTEVAVPESTKKTEKASLQRVRDPLRPVPIADTENVEEVEKERRQE